MNAAAKLKALISERSYTGVVVGVGAGSVELATQTGKRVITTSEKFNIGDRVTVQGNRVVKGKTGGLVFIV